MTYIFIFFILIIICVVLFVYQKEGFDMYSELHSTYPREGQYSADMFGSRDIPVNLCSKII